jgi:hypothetical protein
VSEDDDSLAAEAWIAAQRERHGPWRCVECGAVVDEVPAVYGTHLVTDCACPGRNAVQMAQGQKRVRSTYPRTPSPKAPTATPDREAFGHRALTDEQLRAIVVVRCDHPTIYRVLLGDEPTSHWSTRESAEAMAARLRVVIASLAETIAREAVAAERERCAAAAEKQAAMERAGARHAREDGSYGCDTSRAEAAHDRAADVALKIAATLRGRRASPWSTPWRTPLRRPRGSRSCARARPSPARRRWGASRRTAIWSRSPSGPRARRSRRPRPGSAGPTVCGRPCGASRVPW